MSTRKAILPPAQVRVSRSLYFAALLGAIERERSILATHDPLYGSARSCCAPGSRCGAYKRSAALLARFERAEEALYGGRRDSGGAEPETAPVPEVSRADATAAPSVFRCAECGDGTRLRAWVHLNAHGPVGADGKIERYDYESEDADEIIEESVTCSVHGEDPVEKLIDGQYTLLSSAIMVGRRYVAGPRGRTA